MKLSVAFAFVLSVVCIQGTLASGKLVIEKPNIPRLESNENLQSLNIKTKEINIDLENQLESVVTVLEDLGDSLSLVIEASSAALNRAKQVTDDILQTWVQTVSELESFVSNSISTIVDHLADNDDLRHQFEYILENTIINATWCVQDLTTSIVNDVGSTTSSVNSIVGQATVPSGGLLNNILGGIRAIVAKLLPTVANAVNNLLATLLGLISTERNAVNACLRDVLQPAKLALEKLLNEIPPQNVV